MSKKLPVISILHTGGTLSSRVDYRTGAVSPKFSPKDILAMFPKLKDIASIKSRLVFQMFSEDMEPEHWLILAREIVKEIKKGVDGVIVTHGTDTLHYTSAALSFMLQDIPIPVLLVGAQRSSDRGSSDADLNLNCAAQFISGSDFSGVGVCMHGSMEDDYCYIHQGNKVRKLHTSRRDAFKSVNVMPYAKITDEGKITFFRNDYPKKDLKRRLIEYISFDSKVALLKGRPGLNPKELEIYKDNKYRGVVLEGTGLGQIGVTVLDKYTNKHRKILQTIKDMNNSGVVIVMTSQTLFGRINMNVYSTGRDLQKAGVISGEDMLPEVAYVKLGWCLSQYRGEKIKDMMRTNISGEITERIVPGQDSFDNDICS